MTKLGSYVHSTKISPEFECQGQRSKVKVTGDKKRKSAVFCSGVVFCGAVLVQHFFSGAVLWDAVLYAGGKISACCLVFVRKLATTSGSLQLCPEIIYTILIVSEILF